MLFNSVDFAIFLPIVFLLYWYGVNHHLRLQNLLIVAASYFFYGWWDVRFLSLIIISTLADYLIGLALYSEKRLVRRKLLLGISILVNLGILGFFKYYNFFLESFTSAFSLLGTDIQAGSLRIILPVGISFYTFQTLSYTIDIYRGKMEPTRDYIAFSAFVAFFPQLVAGPIERAVNLLPQFYTRRRLSYQNLSAGLKMMLWGLFMKMVVADRLGLYVQEVYGHAGFHSGPTLVVATLFFGFQIYCDFAGYSAIAIGTARLFDFRLMQNFNRPYLAHSFKDFWSRWHISLSSWFRDYLYIPLGGSRKGPGRTNINLMITFMVSGLWHGANWTFIIWGALHGSYLIIEKQFSRWKMPKYLQLITVFVLANFAWIFFRAASLGEAMQIMTRIFSAWNQGFYFGDKGIFFFSLMAIALIMANDMLVEYRPGIRLLNNPSLGVRYASVLVVIIYLIALGVFDNSQFIYFQF